MHHLQSPSHSAPSPCTISNFRVMFISVQIWFISTHICLYQTNISAYMFVCLYLLICIYLCILFIPSSQGSKGQQRVANHSKVPPSHLALCPSHVQCIVHICAYAVNIQPYWFVSDLYQCIYAHIYLYMCISVHISKLQFEGKPPNFWKKGFFILNSFSKQAGLSAPQKSKIPMSSPGVEPRTFRCHAAALTTWLTLLWIFSFSYGTYFPKMFISVYICLYTCICVCMCAFTVYTPNQGVYDPYRSLYGLGARSWGQRRRLLAVGNWYLQYEQIWARYVYERICSNLLCAGTYLLKSVEVI